MKKLEGSKQQKNKFESQGGGSMAVDDKIKTIIAEQLGVKPEEVI